MKVAVREEPHLRIDDLGYIIIGELSKPRQENLKSISRHVDQKPPVVKHILEALIEKDIIKKRKNNRYELLTNLFKRKDKPDKLSIEIIQYLCEPALLSASQLTKRAAVRAGIKDELVKEQEDNKLKRTPPAIQLVLKRLKTLENYGIIIPVAV
jgi:predicted transcriptional regulator